MVQRKGPYVGCYSIACTVADSYIQDSSRTPGAVAELAATKKEVKYSMLAGTHIFQPLAFESHGPENASAIPFIKELGHRISQRCPTSNYSCDNLFACSSN